MARAKVVSINRWRALHPGNGVCESVAELLLPFARRCAAHLIVTNMARLRARGCIYVHVDVEDMEPRWLRMAIAALSTARWETSIAFDEVTNENVYRISRRKGLPHGELAA